jgi:type II secretory pathway pseudopilin PulG
MRKAYTITEFCIVAAVLMTVSIVTLPELGRASMDSRTSQTLSIIQNIQNQIDLYKHDHNGALPGRNQSTFEQALCGKTDKFGAVFTAKLANMGLKNCGPYITCIPANPFNGNNSVRIDGELAGNNTNGWRFDSTTGIFESDVSIK